MGHIAHEWLAINRDDGWITFAHVNIRYGGFKDVLDERDGSPTKGQMVSVWRWRGRVDPDDDAVKARTTWKKRIDVGGHPQVEFTAKDFGAIRTQAELETFLDGELDKLKGVILADDDKDSLTFEQPRSMKIKPGQEK